jgi:hypothetical protein
VFPCGQQPPTASNVNYAKGQDIPNFVIATPGVSGEVCVFSSAPADVIVDVSGYFEQGTGFTATAAPVRLLDSRETTRIAAGTSKQLTVAGDLGIAADARGVAMNVTAVGASADGFMTVYPCGQSTPVASNLNYTKARDVANFVLAKPGTDGKVCFYSDKTVDIVVDVAGYYGANSSFTPIPNPTRILDTRTPSANRAPAFKIFSVNPSCSLSTNRDGIEIVSTSGPFTPDAAAVVAWSKPVTGQSSVDSLVPKSGSPDTMVGAFFDVQKEAIRTYEIRGFIGGVDRRDAVFNGTVEYDCSKPVGKVDITFKMNVIA